MPKCVLAFSGSLESLLAIPWLKEHRDYDVITLSVNLGGEPDLQELGETALLAGAVAARIEDLQDNFYEDFIAHGLRSLAHYETYLLTSALARPLIARELVRVALEEGATAVAHGSSVRNNDQVRFMTAVSALAPHLKLLSPQHEWDLRTYEQRVDYAKSKRLPIPKSQSTPYKFKYDQNLWGQSIRCQLTDDPLQPPPNEAFTLTKGVLEAPDKPEEITIEFLAGLPVALNGQRLPPVKLIETLNQLAGNHGIGRTDLIEDRLVGFKSREIYEAPGATVLYTAKRGLEQMTLSRETLQVREGLGVAYGRCVYNGQWFSDLREGLDAFFTRINQNVTGRVTVRLYKGSAIVIARHSDFSLYSAPQSTDVVDHESTKGFIKVYSMPLTAEARRSNRS